MISICPATILDFPVLSVIEDEADQIFRLFDPDIVADLPPATPESFATLPEDSVIFVAQDDAKGPVGFIIGQIIDGQAYLKQVSVSPTATRQGIGRLLIDKIISWARDKKCQILTLTTFRDLPFNGIFYQKLGFTEFEPDEKWPELRAVRQKEKDLGIEIIPRICMKISL